MTVLDELNADWIKFRSREADLAAHDVAMELLSRAKGRKAPTVAPEFRIGREKSGGRKYSEDQERDESGRWSDQGGESRAPSSNLTFDYSLLGEESNADRAVALRAANRASFVLKDGSIITGRGTQTHLDMLSNAVVEEDRDELLTIARGESGVAMTIYATGELGLVRVSSWGGELGIATPVGMTRDQRDSVETLLYTADAKQVNAMLELYGGEGTRIFDGVDSSLRAIGREKQASRKYSEDQRPNDAVEPKVKLTSPAGGLPHVPASDEPDGPLVTGVPDAGAA